MFSDTKIYQPACIEVRVSPLHGRGVFATTNISRGAIIETAPALFLSGDEKELLRHSPLFHYYFLVSDARHPAVFGFGYSCFYNHAAPANGFYSFSRKKGVVKFFAFKKILAGEEITINYNGSPYDERPVYFPA